MKFIQLHTIEDVEFYINADTIESLRRNDTGEMTVLITVGSGESYYQVRETPDEIVIRAEWTP